MVKQLKQKGKLRYSKVEKKTNVLTISKIARRYVLLLLRVIFFENFKALIKDFQVLKPLIRKELSTNMTKNNLWIELIIESTKRSSFGLSKSDFSLRSWRQHFLQ